MLYVIGFLVRKDFFKSWTTVQHLTDEKLIYIDVQDKIRHYHGSLEDVPGNKAFGASLDGYESFINNYEEVISKGKPNREGYQGPLDFTDRD